MPNKTSAKSAKAVKVAGKVGPARKSGAGQSKLAGKLAGIRRIPWLTIGAAVVIIGLIGALAVYLVPKYQEKADLEKYTPSEAHKDPSDEIEGVVKQDFPAGLHIGPDQRVAYDRHPPFGGPHDSSWATCMGTVYDKPIREENAVHSLEHGAIWITYNPAEIDSAGIEKLKDRVKGEQYMMLSPHPDQEAPISLQSWGHQLSVDSADDKRIGRFITALRLNPNTYPEIGADCSTIVFDTDNPPPYDPTPPGPNAVPMDGAGLTPDQSELGGLSGMPGLPPGIPGIPGIPGMPGTQPPAGTDR